MGFWAEPLKMRTKPKTEVFCSLLRSRSWWAFDLRLEPSPDTKVRYFQMNSMLIACLSSNDRFLFIFSQIHPKLFAACLLRVTWMNKADTGLALMRCSLWITWTSKQTMTAPHGHCCNGTAPGQAERKTNWVWRVQRPRWRKPPMKSK